MAEAEAVIVDNKLQVSNSRPRVFYARVARKYFEGSKDKAAVKDINVLALGQAIGSAVGVAASLERNKVAVIKKVETSLHESKNESGKGVKSLPKISIYMEMHPEYVPEPHKEESEDEEEHADDE
eukprot:GDKI01048012.1.p1 GENE.GDKI01048012.1~~GDKI01048012.1.p1  ORF type:complete len:125 (-),score=49.72 GDKI01048012.1:414-788(-)